MFDKLNEECGIFGVFNHPEASKITYLGLHGLQHRGQESAGIVSADGVNLHAKRQMGLVQDIFSDEVLERLSGKSAIGHVRYSTAGSSTIKNAQPFEVKYANGSLAIAHNGNLVNAPQLREELEAKGSIFQSSMDTEIIVHLLAQPEYNSFVERIENVMNRVNGAYSLLLLNETRLVAVRDPHGFRPLVLGRLGESIVIASETCAFDLVEATYEREIEPGEILVIGDKGMTSHSHNPAQKRAACIFEYIYFSRPDSIVFGQNVHSIRKELGRQLARENPVDADMVVPVPDSGVPAALGYAEESGLPFEMGLIRSHYVGRTFIEPTQSIRHFGVKLKLNPVREVLKGKRVVVVDDSIVRGTTSRKIIKMIREAGAKEVHIRISSPPTLSPCFYGIDTPTKAELIAATHTLDEINKYLTSDTLSYLSIEGLLKACGGGPNGEGFCLACFNGEYPLDFPTKKENNQLGLFGTF